MREYRPEHAPHPLLITDAVGAAPAYQTGWGYWALSRTSARCKCGCRTLRAAGGHARDFAILTLFLQTGIRISELCALELEDIDTKGRTLRVREGKGQSARTVELEKKGAQAVTSWLRVRPETLSEALFLGRDGEPLKEWGVRDLLAKYCAAAGIKKAITPHSLRHTFVSYKAERGVSAFQLKEWLGHRKLDTTQIYVHMARKNAKKVMEATSL